MNNEEPNISLYGNQDGSEEFPVLKAFQQYIDAEQAKARRRMLTLSIFFACILTAVVVIFAVLFIRMMANSNGQIQVLNDRLIELALKDRAPQADNAETVKALTEAVAAMKQQPAASIATAATSSEELKLKLEREELELKRKQLEDQKKAYEYEQSRQRQLRKIYPEYYEDEDLIDDELDEEDAYRPTVRRSRPKAAKKARPVKRPSSVKPSAKIEDQAKQDDETSDELDEPTQEELDNFEPIDYFKEDSYEIPVEVKGGTTSKWSVPLN